MSCKYGPILVYLLLALPATAQEQLALSQGEIDQLEILFAPVQNMDRQSGSRIPAMVITSPDVTSKVNSYFPGTLIQWHAYPGQRLDAGAAIASVRSDELLSIHNQWLKLHSEITLANFELERDQQLFDLGIIAEQRLQLARKRFEQIQIEFTSLETRLQQAGFTRNTLDQLRDSGTGLGIYSVRAPVAGVLAHRTYVTGEVVDAHSELALIQQSDIVWVAAEIPARLATHLEPGFELSMADSGQALVVRQKDLVVNDINQTIEVLAEFMESTGYLPGQVVTLIVPPPGEGVVVPAAAVVHGGDKTTVFVRTATGVETRDLVLEPAGVNYIARSGIVAGEQIAVQGAAILKGMQLGLGQSE